MTSIPRMTKLALAAALALAAGPAAAEDVYATFDTTAGKIGVKLLPGEAPSISMPRWRKSGVSLSPTFRAAMLGLWLSLPWA